MRPFDVSFVGNFSQEADCCDPGEPYQYLQVQTMDGGGGPFLVLETGRWAIDDIDQFAEMLRWVLKRGTP